MGLSGDKPYGLNGQGIFERPKSEKLTAGRITVYIEAAQNTDGNWYGGYYLRSRNVQMMNAPRLKCNPLFGPHQSETRCREAATVSLIRYMVDAHDDMWESATADEKRDAHAMIEKLQEYCNSLRQMTLAL